MKTDLYTKIVLTVIALALTINLIKDFTITTAVQASVAQIPQHKPAAKDTVIIGGIVDVNLIQILGDKVYSLNYNNSERTLGIVNPYD